jgi:hypothetical protein
VASLAVVLALTAAAGAALAALPPFYGGEVRIPAPAEVTSLDPAEAASPFDAAVASAVSEGLYRVADDGAVVPLLADGMPVIEGDIARIRVRRDVRRHAGTLLTPLAVESTLRRAARHPRAAWLLSAFARDGAEPDVRIAGEDAIEIRLDASVARTGRAADQPCTATCADVARVLAAAPLALATGRDPARRPLGTGPYSARFVAGGELRLAAFRFAAEGAPYIESIRITPVRSREESLRAFELGRIDGSWHGESLYGGRPVRPVASVRAAATAPVLLVPNRSRGALRDASLWGHVASRIDRRRLERVGLRASSTLGTGLPAAGLGSARRPSSRTSLRMIVRAGDPFEIGLAEALAGILDEASIALRVEALPASRYDAAVAAGGWDLRAVTVVPPLPGPTPLAGAALAAAGQLDRARSLAARLTDAEAGTAAARGLDALVLGHRTPVLSHPTTIHGVRFDPLGVLDLGEMYLDRAEPR